MAIGRSGSNSNTRNEDTGSSLNVISITWIILGIVLVVIGLIILFWVWKKILHLCCTSNTSSGLWRRDANRNIELSQIETFDRLQSKISPYQVPIVTDGSYPDSHRDSIVKYDGSKVLFVGMQRI